MKAVDLQREFDHAFTRPRPPPAPPTVELLAVRAGKLPLAFHITQFRRLMRCPPVVRLPSSAPSVLGIAGVRRQVVVLHSLARLMGEPDDDSGHWAVLCTDDIALVFTAIDGSVRIASDQFHRARAGSVGGEEAYVSFAGAHRRVVEIGTLISSIGSAL